jgi:hypothetical protein
MHSTECTHLNVIIVDTLTSLRQPSAAISQSSLDILNENDYHLINFIVLELQMKHLNIVSQTRLPSNTACKVLYRQSSDTVEIEVGGTTLKFEANSFIVINEMLRKVAAKIVMQTNIENVA